MPLKVIRRPYQDCAYRWALSTSGISTGEGDCSDEQCEDLNGDFLLDFSACDSKGGKLVWAGDCEAASSDQNTPCAIDGCGSASRSISWDGVMPDIPAGVTRSAATAFTGTLAFSQSSNSISGCCSWRGIGEETIGVEDNNRSLVPFVPEYGDTWPLHQKYWHASFAYGAWTVKLKYEAVFIALSDKMTLIILMHVMPDDPSDPDILTTVEAIYEVDTTGECEESYTLERVTLDARTVCEKSHVITSPQVWIWSDEYTVSGLSGGTNGTGPETNDRIRSKWHLSYEIEAQLWTLRSFNRIDYPIYTLSDASPCDGETKTLLLSDKGDAADGCGVAPAEMTITRVCPPDRVGKSALLEDRKPNGATGKRKRQCGCDCLDEVDDRRHTCATKCASAATEGCERIDPAPDDITCRYPEAINCCANTAGKDVPCAYTVEFECDLFFDDGESVRHKIAAKQVTLRRECYFEDPCLFVAPGPESSTGGSPVMDVDGFPGAQPACSSCSDLCLTGCTWSAWKVAACPAESALCEAAADKTKCLEFRWLDVLGTGYTTGAVASVLRFVSETVASSGLIIWEYASDDGRWFATIYPNAQVNVNVVCGSGATCGEGVLTWLDSPEVSPCGGWRSQNYTQPSGASGPCQDWDIVDDGITFSNICFGCSCTTLQLYWIACP